MRTFYTDLARKLLAQVREQPDEKALELMVAVFVQAESRASARMQRRLESHLSSRGHRDWSKGVEEGFRRGCEAGRRTEASEAWSECEAAGAARALDVLRQRRQAASGSAERFAAAVEKAR